MKSILKRKNKKGFTLMEMLIVIGIIAVLVAIAIPTFSSAQKKAKYTADLANVRSYYAEQVSKKMVDDTYVLGTDKDKVKLQMKGASITVTGTIAEEFEVVYDPNGGSTADEAGFPSVTFPTKAASTTPTT
ncbi:type II secretion system protein [Anaerotignum propionicum]|uniref:type II secretion system protein n=1 Tax=Anaerotignum propionicum TaxID=28446 RepID=UPI00210E1265|nr:prepilin-type N-terminal cleavage/methylation domain-containing protein [Anaerotignum propionicum]MCQ4935818.1 prepilin-type N-terminal cleavage/methylation domain-containing protein [Anaerotignum propionicum]